MTHGDRPFLLKSTAHALAEAERTLRPVPIISASIPDLTIAEAYTIAGIRNAELASVPIGYKLGYTSAAMRQQMGVNEPNYGVLSVRNAVSKDEIAFDQLIHPLVEPELTVLLGRDLVGPGVGWNEAWDAVEAVMPSIVIVDTRYESYSFTAVDNISDNSSASRFVLGERIARADIANLRDVSVELKCNGQVIDTGWGRDAMGDPVIALAWLANALARSGTCIKAGEIVMTGGLTRAHRAEASFQFSASFGGLGAAAIHFI